jgi:LacI family transcriptional regulator
MTKESGYSMTIIDVARLGGVSTTTVSRVINKIPTVNKETQEKIRQIINQLNYRPNAFAQALAKSRTRRILL